MQAGVVRATEGGVEKAWEERQRAVRLGHRLLYSSYKELGQSMFWGAGVLAGQSCSGIFAGAGRGLGLSH
jgi:hypothetical protein